MDSSTTLPAPSTYPYKIQALLDFPRRVFSPPKPGVPRVGRVRQLSLTPIYEVRLEDVLSGKHLPPLTLPEFQAYLLYTERSPENLQFLLWFKDYTQMHQKWTQSSIYPKHSPSLAYSYSRAKQTFFTRAAPLELNLPAHMPSTLFTAHPRAHPPPSAFADVRHAVEGMLTESLNNFVRSRSANAGRNRGLVAIFIGLCVMCVGLAPILMSVLAGRSRWIRFAALPCFWFGAMTFICGMHGVCIVIFLFGDARQLTTYELARPKITHDPLSRNVTLPTSHQRPSRLSMPPKGSFEHIELTLPKPTLTPDSHTFYLPEAEGVTTPNASEPKLYKTEDYGPHAADEKSPRAPDTSTPSSPTSPAVVAPFLMTPPASICQSFDFDYPARTSSETSSTHSSPVFAPLTKALDRIAIRTYWETVMRSAALALLIACILVGVSVAAHP